MSLDIGTGLEFDLAVVGAGIVGIACAWAASKRGLKVVLIDRGVRQVGASVRNFGMVWPIGQPPGVLLQQALRSREMWLEASAQAGFWHEACGSMFVARHDDELGVLEECVSLGRGSEQPVRMLTPDEAVERSPWLVRAGLRGAMLSGLELTVEPRQAIEHMTGYLSERCGVHVLLGAAVSAVEPPLVRFGGGKSWLRAERVCVCTGEDLRLLYPEVFAHSGLTICKLQMMRTMPQPEGQRLGPILAAGSTMRHYRSFAACPSVERVRARFAAERPEFDRWGIHVMANQTPAGELTIGDSHEYGEPVQPFLRDEIDRVILDYLATFVRPPEMRIAERWYGCYPKFLGDATEFVASPHPAVKVVNGVGGSGMTLSFGLAEIVMADWFGYADQRNTKIA